MLARTPCIITGNHSQLGKGFLAGCDESALNKRIITFNFNTEFRCTQFITNKEILKWLTT